MASVTSITVDRADEIENNSVISGHMAGSDLVLVTAGGTQINCGRVIQAAYNNWPIGSIFMHISDQNPSDLLGGGTWVRWGRGCVPVSVDEAQTEFNTVQKLGGEKTVQLTTTTMPPHSHGGATGTDSPDHAHTGSTGGFSANHHHGVTDTQGGHIHALTKRPNLGTSDVAGGAGTALADAQTDNRGAHAHNTSWASNDHSHNFTSAGSTARHAHGVTQEGGGGFHNNLQPYITVYMWLRTA